MSNPIPALPRYYTGGTHQDGSASFGSPWATLDEALADCKRRHMQGYRYLRIYDREKHLTCRYNIIHGAGPWYADPMTRPGTGPLIGSV